MCRCVAMRRRKKAGVVLCVDGEVVELLEACLPLLLLRLLCAAACWLLLLP